MIIFSELTKRQSRRLKVYNSIIEAAEKRFFEKGYDNVTMDEVADDVEFSKAALYRYFKNKPSLFFSVVIKGMVLLRDTFENAIKEEKTGLGKIKAITRAFRDYLQDHSDFYRLNLSAREPRFSNMLQTTEKSENKIEKAEEYIQLTKELFEMLYKIVKLGIKDSTLRKDLGPIQIVMFLSTAIESTIQITPVNKLILEMFKITKEDYYNQSMELLLHGLVGKEEG